MGSNNSGIIIVGASGLVGRYALRCFRRDFHNVIGTHNKSSPSDLVKYNLITDDFHRVVSKFNRPVPQPCYVVICVKFGLMDDPSGGLKNDYQTELLSVKQLLSEIKTLDMIPIYISSNAVFDGEIGNYDEEEKKSPISAYGTFISEVENEITTSFDKHLIIRINNIVSCLSTEHHLFSDWHHKYLSGQPIECIKNQIFSPTYVGDIARCLLLAINLGLNGTYHVANGEHFKRSRLAQKFLDTYNSQIPIFERSNNDLGLLDPRPINGHLNSNLFISKTRFRFSSMGSVLRGFRRFRNFLD